MFPSHRLLKKQALIVLSLTVILHGGNGFSWFRAQKECKASGEQIRTAPRSNNFYWTTYHKRRYQWIGTLECYSHQDLSHMIMRNLTLNIPSAGLCQERCTEEMLNDSFLFALKQSSCLCLNKSLEKPSHSSQHSCKYNCLQDNITRPDLFCGGESVYSLFISFESQKNKIKPVPNFDSISMECNTTKLYEFKRCSRNQLKEKK
ncbi:uncharacterized protein LOC134263487 [Saccostrea cucullata]|uniref:uncharacterized protein LOC134263487 n=1 Tax=Saccostrea cuccullata TaxID=36930 RepID=UPI002ED633DD